MGGTSGFWFSLLHPSVVSANELPQSPMFCPARPALSSVKTSKPSSYVTSDANATRVLNYPVHRHRDISRSITDITVKDESRISCSTNLLPERMLIKSPRTEIRTGKELRHPSHQRHELVDRRRLPRRRKRRQIPDHPAGLPRGSGVLRGQGRWQQESGSVDRWLGRCCPLHSKCCWAIRHSRKQIPTSCFEDPCMISIEMPLEWHS